MPQLPAAGATQRHAQPRIAYNASRCRARRGPDSRVWVRGRYGTALASRRRPGDVPGWKGRRL